MSKHEEMVSCVMCTYRRATCVERSIQFFLDQDYKGEKELIIFNTDIEHPLELSRQLEKSLGLETIIIINNNTDYFTGQPYDNVGSIRRDSARHANGKYYICWDDDDVFLPWNIRQCMDGLEKNPDVWAWKPDRSMFWKAHHDEPELAGNVMEASIISRLDKIREYGFRPHQGGGEHLSWEEGFRKEKKFVVDKQSIPAYCFNWHDQGDMRGHKQSGTYGKKDNFKHHKENTKDYAKEPLKVFDKSEINEIYRIHTKVIKENIEKDNSKDHGSYVVKQEIVDKYINDCGYKKLNISKSIINPWAGISGTENFYIKHMGKTMPKKGFFFECGAHDGKHMSTTFGLEKEYGWDGILVEAHSGLFKLLKKNARSAICVNECIGLSGQKVFFKENYEGHVGHSQIVQKENTPTEMRGNLIERKSKSIEEILSENNAPRQIDYMVIDVEEGYENAIMGIDFEKRNIIFLCLEIHGNPKDLINYICDKGYTVARIFGQPPGSRDFVFVKTN